MHCQMHMAAPEHALAGANVAIKTDAVTNLEIRGDVLGKALCGSLAGSNEPMLTSATGGNQALGSLTAAAKSA